MSNEHESPLPSPSAIADGRDDMPPPQGANMADNPERYQSRPESIALARETMREIKEALTTDSDGKFPVMYADVDWGRHEHAATDSRVAGHGYRAALRSAPGRSQRIDLEP